LITKIVEEKQAVKQAFELKEAEKNLVPE